MENLSLEDCKKIVQEFESDDWYGLVSKVEVMHYVRAKNLLMEDQIKEYIEEIYQVDPVKLIYQLGKDLTKQE